ncbi:MAG TPA: hypothetical protein VFK04_06385 [Gemmatimonadaceae bacterium]|nr:hypothetical protein [Gemmatimonadaceae bacterium]
MVDDHDLPPPLHGPDDEVPRGGRWAICSMISFASALAIAIVPQPLKVPLGVLSVLALFLAIGMLMLGPGAKRDDRAPAEEL